MTKIALLGAGSTVFAKNVIADILSFPELRDVTLSLHDIDPKRLATSEMVARKVADHFDARPTIDATLDRRRSLDGADFAITTFQVGGYVPCTVTDFEMPKRYGLRQTIADTVGIGGIMRGLRTIPVLLAMCEDMEQLCPGATLLQYVNPMAANCWAIDRASSIATVGLCHSVRITAETLAEDIGLPVGEIDYLCAGINHMAFFLRFERRGEDLFPRIREVGNRGSFGRRYRGLADKVRYEVLRRTNYFVTESSEHFAEYVPWFIKRDRLDLIDRFEIPLDEYPIRCELQIAEWEATEAAFERGELDIPEDDRQGEASLIIHSMVTDTRRVIYGNVPNSGLIGNLPEGCCVEVPCVVDGSGLRPTVIGDLPPHLAALMQTSVNVQSLIVEAALSGKREHIYHAAMLDPHTAAELDLEQIWRLVDELIEAHGDWLPEYH